jgi:hypothetical protein
MPGLLLVRAGVLDVVTIVHEVAPAMRLCLLMGALYLVVRLHTGDGRLAAAALPAVMIVGHAVESLLARHIVRMPPALSYMIRSESGAAGLVVWATVFALLAVHARARREQAARALLLAAAVAGLSFGFKTHFFTLFAAAFLTAVGIVSLRERSARLLVAVAVALGCFLAVFLAWPTHESYGGVELAPGAFARTYLAMSLDREPSPGLRKVLTAVYGDLGTPAGAALATVLATARITLFSPLVPAFALRTARRFRSASVLDLSAMLVFPVFVAMASLLGARWVEGDTTGVFLAQVARGVTLTSSVVTFLAAAAWARESPRRTKALLASVLVASVVLVPALRPAEVRPGPLLDPGRRCALAFLRHRTPLDAVVLDAAANGESNIYAEVAGLAGRRSVLEHVGGRADAEHDRPGDLRQFYRTDDAAEATRIIDRYGVGYVLERPQWPLRFPKDHLRLVFEGEGHRVYAAGPAGREADTAGDATPGRRSLLTAWPGLACP